ncbi:amphi-Trp domain-containing protein [Sinorhizobium sp. RAC02]|uniref:amphi-Trp domain-containing protein n=1 Tax=Sinorhizobium sp. RAC02 TaxID=1842534 RepID=UPI00083D2CEC|nr:amphi-Trp domain-containing protein [Sinorhizobium sp. RAC02]AOF93288.1 amphi-Trp domain protein [Sinorhizobium sp. RAC02]
MDANREIEKDYSLTEFIAELRRLADTLESNERFSIQIDEEDVQVPEHAIASIAYEIEDGRAEIEFQLTWEAGEAEGDVENDKDEDESEEAAA